MMALLAKKDEKCAFQLDSVEAGDGPGAMCVTGLQFKYDSSKELLRDSTTFGTKEEGERPAPRDDLTEPEEAHDRGRGAKEFLLA